MKKKDKKLIKKAWIIFTIILILTLLAEFAVHMHVTFGYEDSLFFNAWFGFLSCAAIVLFSKFVGIFLKKPTDYYIGENDDK